MNLVIVTPGSCQSAIARSTSLVVHALKKLGHAVDIIRAESEKRCYEVPFTFAKRALHWTETSQVRTLLINADLIIYEIGDNYEYHAGCLPLMEIRPGLVVLHDAFLVDLFLEHYKSGPLELIKDQLKKWYGTEITNRLFSALNTPSFYDFASQHAPMTENMVHQALGVVSHSLHHIDRVLTACSGPVACIPLAYDAPLASSIKKDISKMNGQYKILTFGYLISNKRARSIIKAIGQNALLQKTWTYRLVGSIEENEKRKLQVLADKLKVSIEFTGSVDDATLAQEITNADIVSCLRYPVLESFSASLIEAMLYAKIIMVTDTHFYHDFPNDCVIKIPLDAEITHIQTCLTHFLEDEKSFLKYGQQAKKWASVTFNANTYAEKLVDVATQILKDNPMTLAIQKIGKDLQNWGINADSPILQAITNPIQSLIN